jgi:hypothetical protein
MPFGSLEGETANLSGELANLPDKAHAARACGPLYCTCAVLERHVRRLSTVSLPRTTEPPESKAPRRSTQKKRPQTFSVRRRGSQGAEQPRVKD